jgi:predicted Zn-dependent protease
LLNFKGSFSDGQTAARRDVDVSVGGEFLTIKFESGVREKWQLSAVDVVEEAYPSQPVRLTYERASEARLTIDDAAFLEALAQIAPHIARRASKRRGLWRGTAIGLACAITTVGLVVFVVPWLSTFSAAFVPQEWESEIGDRVVEQLAMISGAGGAIYCEDVDGTAALRRMTDRMSEHLDIPYPLRIRVVASPMVNAFAAPGGNIAVMAGLIKKAETPDEVAGVLAHEIGHVLERHPTEGMIKQFGLGVILEAISGGVLGSDTMSGVAGTLIALSYNRESETEADRAAVRILNDAGISRRGLVRFFERLRQQESKGVKVPAFLSSHPLSEEREANLRAGADAGDAAMSEEDWRAFKRICDG